MTSSTAGVHDLFRDMYGSPAQHHHHRSSPDNQPYMSRPQPVAATPTAYSPAPYSTPNSFQRDIPVQVHHMRPNVHYNASYAEKDEDKPKPYVAKVQEDSYVPTSHFTAVSDKKARPFVARSVSDNSAPPPPPGGKVYSVRPPTKPPQSPVSHPPRAGQASPDVNRPFNYSNIQTRNQPSPPTTPSQGPYSPNLAQSYSTPTPPCNEIPPVRDGQYSPSVEIKNPRFLNQKPRPFLASPLHQPPSFEGGGFPTPPPEASMPAVHAGATTPTSAPPTPGTLPTPPPPPPPPLPSPVDNPSSTSKPTSKDSQVGLFLLVICATRGPLVRFTCSSGKVGNLPNLSFVEKMASSHHDMIGGF